MAQKRKFQKGGKNQKQKEAFGQGKKQKKAFERKKGAPTPAPAPPSSSDEESGDELPELAGGASAYQALLSQLHSSGGRNAQAMQQRLKEQQGGDTDSESEEDVPQGEEEADDDSAESELGHDEAGNELDESAFLDDLGSGLEDGETGDEGSEGEESEGKESEGDESEGEESGGEDEKAMDGVGKQDGEGSDEDTEAGGEDVGVESDEDDERGGPESDEEERRASNGDASTSAVPDPFEVHMGRQLTESEVALLGEGSLRKFSNSAPAEGLSDAQWLCDRGDLPDTLKGLEDARLRPRLAERWRQLRKKAGKKGDFDSPLQAQFFTYCAHYHDIFHHQKPLPGSRPGASEESDSISDAVLLHTLNHVIKTRERIVKNNTKLHKKPSADTDAAGREEGPADTLPDDTAPRDQGFTRPKVLIVLPYRSVALKVVKRMLDLLPPAQKITVEHEARFLDDFGVEEDEEAEALLQKAKKQKKGDDSMEAADAVLTGAKPAEHRALFGGNNDDHFRIGLKLTRKSVKLYADFYTSDVIVASPLGLTTRIAEAEGDKDADVDFLSSIEIVLVDYADVIYMQNWQNLVLVFEHLNRLPTKQHGSDLMRTREWYLNGWAKFYRQTIILGATTTAEMNALFHRHCFNAAGRIKLKAQSPGVLSKVIPRVRQLFERVPCGSAGLADDARFDYFTKQVFPRIKDSVQGGVLIFTRSYYDFVRLRNFLRTQNASFAALGDYTKQSDISRGRAWFFHGKRQFLLYTERAHFYHRYRIRGIKDLVFYSLPEYPNYYAELLNLLEGTDAPTCTALFAQHGDNLELERIVGTSRARKMSKSENKTFMFC
ncbi:protein with digestive organ expansion factor domain [Klebsormidium nitens]|uniref:Protein with digestive organ expansion factor domain n=1 Tax=Klebsormidium nitens TaxID=105231 RepID=A0A1Y1HW08_KLENI|nr:protein with digestive organ expansion factor domain [Klebsormidium nitens]|eukprot:GAQ80028.1 protein with digestive organ expansion factor domain [Klebsormidium nitens]